MSEQEIKMDEQETKSPASEPTQPVKYGEVVKCFKLNIRKQPFIGKRNILQVIDKGDVVEVLSNKPVQNDWVKVKLNDGTVGFTMKEYIKVIN